MNTATRPCAQTGGRCRYAVPERAPEQRQPALPLTGRSGDTPDMTLEGWDHIPRGYGAEFVLDDAPWWLRLWFHTPFVDRYAHPAVVSRGYGFLTAHPHDDDAAR